MASIPSSSPLTRAVTRSTARHTSLQSAVPDVQFIDGYVAAAAAFGVEYTPIIAGQPSLYEGGAAFPGNNWRTDPEGQSYLGRIPVESHDELAEIRAAHLRLIDHAQRMIHRGSERAGSEMGLLQSLSHLPCRL